MSVYRPKASPFFHYDFQVRARRFHGSTGCRNRRQAEAVERSEREKAKRAIDQGNVAAAALTIDAAAGRYWTEVGQHHVCSKETWVNLERLVEHFGRDRRLAEVKDSDIASLVAWRRGHPRWGRKGMALISPATVNRSTTEVLQKVFTRAREVWGARFDHEPRWGRHMLAEPEERVRELQDDEAGRLDEAVRADYEPFLSFARATGARFSECLLLRWVEVNWSTREIVTIGKKQRKVVMPITPLVAELLWPLRGHHPDRVFTYVAQRTRDSRVRGRRYPMTESGAKSQWKRDRARADVVDFRFHDIRHDVGTKLLRETGNLKLVQRALNHADIKTTTRYAHVLNEEVATALDRLQESRKKSRNTIAENQQPIERKAK